MEKLNKSGYYASCINMGAKQATMEEAPGKASDAVSVQGKAADTLYRPTLREEAENAVGYHRTEADKKDRAVAFLREHPEFDEFIQLIREGVLQV